MAEEKSLASSNTPRDSDESKTLKIRRGRVESVDLYEIKDSELDQLESGSPADLQFNFAIFLLSMAFSGICTLATASFEDDTVKNIFLVVSVVGVLFGGYLMISWWRNRSSLKDTCKKIRERISPDIVQAAKQDSRPPASPEDAATKG